MFKKNKNKGLNGAVISLLMAFFLILGGIYFVVQSTNSPLADFLNPPQKRLEKSLAKMNTLDTLYSKFEMTGTTKVTQTSYGYSNTLDFIVTGNLSGSVKDEVTQLNFSIASPKAPTRAVNFSAISMKNGDYYIKGPTTRGQWVHYSKKKFEEVTGKNPTDGSLFLVDIASTVLSKDQVLLETINPENIEYLGTEIIDDKEADIFSIDLAVPSFLIALGKSSEFSKKEVADAKKILDGAILDMRISIDKKSGYVAKIVLNGEGLKQIQTEETKKYGISSEHTAQVTMEFSRFNLPTSVAKPTDFVEYSEMYPNEVLGIFDYQNEL
jgi:hypothetical protein